VDVVEVDTSSSGSSDSTNSDASDDYVDGELQKRYFDGILPSDLRVAVDIVMRPLPKRTPKEIVSRIFKVLRRVTNTERETEIKRVYLRD